MGRTLVRRGTPTISLSAAQLVAASGLTAVALPVGGLESIDPGPAVVVAALVLSVFCTAITFHLTYRIINDEGATNAAVVGYLLPVVSVLLGAVVLGEGLSVRVVLGMAVVLVGVGMTRRKDATATAPARTGEAATAGSPASAEETPAKDAPGTDLPSGPASGLPSDLPPTRRPELERAG